MTRASQVNIRCSTLGVDAIMSRSRTLLSLEGSIIDPSLLALWLTTIAELAAPVSGFKLAHFSVEAWSSRISVLSWGGRVHPRNFDPARTWIVQA